MGCTLDRPDRKPEDLTTIPDAADKNNAFTQDVIDRPTVESKPTIALDECPLEKLKLMLVPSMDDDRRSSPGRVGSGSVVTAVSPASVMSGIDEGPFSFSEGDVTKSRVSPIQRLLRLTGSKGSSLRFFIDEGSGGGGASGGVQIASPRPAV